MMNSPQVAGGMKANRGVAGGLLDEIHDNEELVVELYLRTLSREPTEDELARGTGLRRRSRQPQRRSKTWPGRC